MHEPVYTINEELDHVIVDFNGINSFTYNYGSSARIDTGIPYIVQTVTPRIQTPNSGYYTAQLYPSDIAYNIENGGNKLNVYCVYNITIKNTETMNIDSVYSEQKLYLNYLKNQFDSNRYDLADDKWEVEGNNIANLKNIGSSIFGNGLNKNEEKSISIQFRIKDSALRTILEQDESRYSSEEYPTVAISNGYHEYLRKDSIWDTNPETRVYRNGATTTDGYFLHKSRNKILASYALTIKLGLGSPRIISGTVFEDNKEEDLGVYSGKSLKVGDGIFNTNENMAGKVKVELLNVKTLADLGNNDVNIADLYQKNGGTYTKVKAITLTKNNGTYEFVGVVPGYYFLRFTYGDGMQEIYTPDGTKLADIKINEYRSTIINSEIRDIIRNANDAIDNSKTEWYKNINRTNKYSVAVDDLSLKNTFDDNIYKVDGSIENGDNDAHTMKAFAPKMFVTIENLLDGVGRYDNSHKSIFDNFNFGITKSPETVINLEKKIVSVDLVTQVGSWLLSGNPKEDISPILSDLDKITEGGSKSVKIETDPQILYGGKLTVTYDLKITNNSDIDLINYSKPEEFYYYGIIDSDTTVKKVDIQEIIDYLDSKYNFDETQEIKSNLGNTIIVNKDNSIISVDVGETGGEIRQAKKVSFEGFGVFLPNESANINYKASSIISANDNMAYYNEAKLSKIKLDKVSTLQTGFNWEEDDTEICIVPSTGKNKSLYLLINTVTALTILGSVIVFILVKYKNK